MPEITLTPAQQVAYDTLLPVLQGESKIEMAVLEGYAGTGKSFLVAQLLAVVAPGRKVAVAAPTNKAVRVIKTMLEADSVPIVSAGEEEGLLRGRQRKPCNGCTLKSIHSFLGLQMKEMDNGQQQASKERESVIRDYDVLIVDEASMLSDDLFRRVMLERDECRVLFVGDPAQLPPINGHGALSPVFDRVDLKVRLAEVVRQATDNPIIRLSMRLRALIEADVKADPLTLLQALPAAESGPTAALMAGTPETLVAFYLEERRASPDSDTRIIAYSNSRVLDYNRLIHRAMYGDTGNLVFMPGEPVIVHSQGKGMRDHGDEIYSEERLITSEELMVLDVKATPQPFYPEIPANRVRMRNALGNEIVGYAPVSQSQLDSCIDALFREWRALKMRADQAQGKEKEVLKEKAADASGKGWALRRAFLNLRHAYAITTHKSQGSSFDCALVDFSDLNRMPDAFEFNRALYVAVTRSREFLAIVVT
jgi:hypothetical protein